MLFLGGIQKKVISALQWFYKLALSTLFSCILLYISLKYLLPVKKQISKEFVILHVHPLILISTNICDNCLTLGVCNAH